MTEKRERVALLPGSYDPITRGHLDVIRRASALFDRVVVAVMTNDMSRYVSGAHVKQYLFPLEERLRLARLACADLPGVAVLADSGMLIDLFDAVGATVLVKGVRNETDFAYEQVHAHWNRTHNPRCETLYLPADPAFDGISSTAVRERLAAGEDILPLVPETVAAEIARYLEEKHGTE